MNLEKYKKEFSDYRNRLVKTIIVWMINRNKGNTIVVYDPKSERFIRLTENSLDILVQIGSDSAAKKSIKTLSCLEIYYTLKYFSKYSGEEIFTSLLEELESLVDSFISDYFSFIKSCKDPGSFIKKTSFAFNCMKDNRKDKYILDHIDYTNRTIYFHGVMGIDIHVDISEVDTILENI